MAFQLQHHSPKVRAFHCQLQQGKRGCLWLMQPNWRRWRRSGWSKPAPHWRLPSEWWKTGCPRKALIGKNYGSALAAMVLICLHNLL